MSGERFSPIARELSRRQALQPGAAVALGSVVLTRPGAAGAAPVGPTLPVATGNPPWLRHEPSDGIPASRQAPA